MGAFVHLHLAGDACYISCDGGRVCRPLIICDRGVPRVTNEHIGKLKVGEWGFEDFLKRGERGSWAYKFLLLRSF
jgi:DNA-directed RNA polymerase III subunit RPC2